MYDGNCTSRDCLSGTYEISGRLILVEQSVQENHGTYSGMSTQGDSRIHGLPRPDKNLEN